MRTDMIRHALFASALGLAGFSAPLLAASPVQKPEKAVTCAACHGESGVSTSGMYPNLAGQYANYLEHTLKDYRGGVRKNPIMAAQAANLSDAEIHQLAAWFSQQGGPLHTLPIPKKPQ